MKKVLALDISTKSGFSIFEGEDNVLPNLINYGLIKNSRKVSEYGKYPYSYYLSALDMAQRLFDLIIEHRPDVVTVEEVNKARNRYTQKVLDNIHCLLIQLFYENKDSALAKTDLVYINSSEWRKITDTHLLKEEKKNNSKVNKLKREGKSKKGTGLKGKITKKHASVRRTNELYGTDFKIKDNDVTDSILLGTSFYLGASFCNGE